METIDNISRFEIAAIRRVDFTVNRINKRLLTICRQIDKLEEERAALQKEIDLWEHPVVEKHGMKSNEILDLINKKTEEKETSVLFENEPTDNKEDESKAELEVKVDSSKEDKQEVPFPDSLDVEEEPKAESEIKEDKQEDFSPEVKEEVEKLVDDLGLVEKEKIPANPFDDEAEAFFN